MNINIVEYPFSCQASTAIQQFPRQVVLSEAISWNLPPWIFRVCAVCAQCRRLTQNHFLKKRLLSSQEREQSNPLGMVEVASVGRTGPQLKCTNMAAPVFGYQIERNQLSDKFKTKKWNMNLIVRLNAEIARNDPRSEQNAWPWNQRIFYYKSRIKHQGQIYHISKERSKSNINKMI